MLDGEPSWSDFGFLCRNSKVDPCTNINYAYRMAFIIKYELGEGQELKVVNGCLGSANHRNHPVQGVTR